MAMKRCPVCGEKYSDTYKDCPFCEEEEALREGEQLRRSGHRAARSRQFSLITPTLIVLILIMAGLLVYLLYGDQIKERFGKHDQPDTPLAEEVIPPEKPAPTQPDEPDVTEPAPSEESGNEPGTMPEEDPSGSVTPSAPASQTDYEKMMALPGGLSLSTTDFTLKEVGETATIRASGGSGSYTWASEDDGIASVDQSGKVTAISKGTVNIVASDGSKKGVCIVRCNVSGSAATTTPSTGNTGTTTASGSGLKAGSAKVVNGGNGVRVRSGPGTNYDVLATIPNGGSVKIVESAGDGWYKITFSDVGGATTTGYMKGDFLANN